jgi:hypothetical protein
MVSCWESRAEKRFRLYAERQSLLDSIENYNDLATAIINDSPMAKRDSAVLYHEMAKKMQQQSDSVRRVLDSLENTEIRNN